MRWRSVRNFLVVVVLLTATWCVWNESVAPSTVATGLLLSVIALVITNRGLLGAPYQELYAVKPLQALTYAGVLLVEIFRSGLHAIYVTLTGRLNVGVVNIPTEIEDPLHGVLVANAITLTPGTVTVEHRKGMFKVIWIDCGTTDPLVAADQIKASFERVFADGTGEVEA